MAATRCAMASTLGWPTVEERSIRGTRVRQKVCAADCAQACGHVLALTTVTYELHSPGPYVFLASQYMGTVYVTVSPLVPPSLTPDHKGPSAGSVSAQAWLNNLNR